MIGTIPVKDEASRVRVERIQNFMRADQVADFAVALVAPAANEVSGQIFVVRGSELFVFNQPRPVRGIARDWTPETILDHRSEEHTSELQSLMRISYAVFCLKKKKKKQNITNIVIITYTTT